MSILSFNEEFYLLTNTDVFAAVNAGVFSSGEEHYILFGDNENRDPTGAVAPVTGVPTTLFSTADYLAVNPDAQDPLFTDDTWYTDINFRYDLTDNVRFTVGIDNLFDEDMQIGLTGTGGASGIFDNVGRFYYGSLTLSL